MARCGCSGSTTCSCFVEAGPGVTVTGSGSMANPFVVSADAQTYDVEDSPSIDFTLTPGSPNIITGIVKLDPAAGNLITLAGGGLRVDCAGITATCGLTNYVFNDTNTVDLVTTGNVITANVKLNPNNNLITATGTGLLVTCTGIRGCLSGSGGIDYDDVTGDISVCISPVAGNALTLDGNNCLFVPQGGGGSINVDECGLLGDGSNSDPLRVNVAAWPFDPDQCPQFPGIYDDVFCNPLSGRLHGMPPRLSDMFTENGNDSPPGPTAITTSDVVIGTAQTQIVNPSSCYDASVLIVWEADVTVQVAPGEQVTIEMNGDGMVQYQNVSAVTQQFAFQQARGVRQPIIAAGGIFNFSNPITIRSTGTNSTYNRVQWRINGIIVSR